MSLGTRKVEVELDGIGGFYASYGFSELDGSVAALGLGNTYGEALEDALDQLAERREDLEIGYACDIAEAAEDAAAAAAAVQCTNLRSQELVDEAWEELRAEGHEIGDDIDDIPQVGLLVRLVNY